MPCKPATPGISSTAPPEQQLPQARANDKRFEQIEAELFENVRPTSLIERFAPPREAASLVADTAKLAVVGRRGAALIVDGGVVKSPL